MVADSVLVDASEVRVSKSPVVFTCEGIGSCVSLCAFDPISKVGGMAHVMLPANSGSDQEQRPARYAELAVQSLLDEMSALGAKTERTLVAMAGGAQVMASSDIWNIGALNTIALKQAVDDRSLTRVAEDLGGVQGRNVTFCMGSGEIRVTTIGGQESVLCNIRQTAVDRGERSC